MDSVTTISAAVLGTEFLKEGIRFLWKQADDVIKLLVARQNGKVKTKTAKIPSERPPKFLKTLPELEVDLEEAARRAGDLAILKKHLESYLDRGITSAEGGRAKGYMDMLQSILEEVYHYKFQLKDPRSQNLIAAEKHGEIEAEEISQHITGPGLNEVTATDNGKIKVGTIRQQIG